MAWHNNLSAQAPSLDFEDWDAWRERQPDYRQRSSNPKIERLRKSLSRTAARPSSAPRVRVSPAADDAVIDDPRPDGRIVRYRPATVELANLEGWDYDFRISFRAMEGDPPRFEVDAVAVVARADGPPVPAGEMRGVGVSEAVRLATAAVSGEWLDGAPLGKRVPLNREGDLSDAHLILRGPVDRGGGHYPSGARSASDEVRAQVQRAAELYHEAQEAGVPTGQFIVQGFRDDGIRISPGTARSRVHRARHPLPGEPQLLPPTDTTRPK